jgi:hypothetical protein
MRLIAAFSMPADIPTRVAAPIARRIQSVATSGFLKGIEQYVRAAT